MFVFRQTMSLTIFLPNRKRHLKNPCNGFRLCSSFLTEHLLQKIILTGGDIQWHREVSDTSNMLGTADVHLQAKLPELLPL